MRVHLRFETWYKVEIWISNKWLQPLLTLVKWWQLVASRDWSAVFRTEAELWWCFNKIFHKNIVKVSYSFMDNISSTISSHSKNILNPVSNTEYGCNCRSKENCSLHNKCLAPKIVYRADVKNLTNDEKKFYLGVTETPFKNVLVTTCRTSNIPDIEIALSYQNMYGNSKTLIYHQLLNGALFEKCYQKCN